MPQMISLYFNKPTLIALIIIALGFSTCIYGQEYTPFTRVYPTGNNFRYKTNIRGDLTFIANSIMNRDGGTTSTEPEDAYNNLNSSGSTIATNLLTETGGLLNYNDYKNMQYIDVDNDNSTFNSSSASFAFTDPNCNLIRYAALYWSATYPSATANGFYNGNTYSPNTVPIGTGRQSDFNQVKFKIPGGTYVDITADEILYNGFTSTDNAMRTNSPYACYADVTNIVTSIADPNGEYTVANIRAVTGVLTPGGGSSGGWTLVMLYENPTFPGKLITTFDGFARIFQTNVVQIDYNGFESIPSGPVNASIGTATLEGDFRIYGDGMRIKAASNSTFSTVRDIAGNLDTNNFFDSNITLNGVQVANTNPNSSNTLGYDTDMFQLRNTNNGVIPNGETAATFEFRTNGDQYYPFFNSFNIEVIEPEIYLLKRVEDLAGNDITGLGVNLGQEIEYLLTFQNVGNDDAINYTIKDVLPLNVTLLEANFVLPAGVTYTYDINTRTVIFTIPNNLVKEDDPTYTIRMRVKVAENCFDFINACNDNIDNSAYSTYQGLINTAVITDDPSIYEFNFCGFPAAGATNFLLDDIEDCDFSRTLQLCGSTVMLSAGLNFDQYIWYRDINENSLIDLGIDTVITDGDPDNDPSTIEVTQLGIYIVDKIVADPCKGFQEIITVELYGSTQTNPILDLFNAQNSDADPNNDIQGEILRCSIDGEYIVNIFLCGINDSEFLEINIPDAHSIEWQKLDETACTSPDAACPNKGNSCYTTIATGNAYTLTEEGGYRLVLNYQNGCSSRFYFNAYKNNLDPQYLVSDIICNTPGNITITNLPSIYEYRLINALNNTEIVPYTSNPSFTIATSGVYTVEIRQQGVINGCIFSIENIGVRNRIFDVLTSTINADCRGLGEINLSALNVEAQYYYEISQGGVSVDTFGPTNDNNYRFTNVNPGSYDIRISTDDGCLYNGLVTIDPQDNPALTAIVLQPITCEVGTIFVDPIGGITPYAYAIWSYVDTSGNTIISYPSVNDIPDAAYQTNQIFDILNPGDYTFIVVDGNNCNAISNTVTIELMPAAEFNVTTVVDVLCFSDPTGTIRFNLINANGYQLTYYLFDASTFDQNNYDLNNALATNSSGYFESLISGDYAIVINQSQGSAVCDYFEYETVDSPTNAITADAILLQDYTCLLNGIIQVQNVSGGTAPYSYSIDGTTFIPDTTPGANTFTGLTAGTYSIIVRDAAGCVYPTNSILIDSLNPPNDIGFITTAPNCPTQTSTITLTAIGGSGTITYEIIAPSAVSNGTSNVFSNLVPDTYTFRITDDKGCAYTENYTLTPVTLVSAIGTLVSNVSCLGDADGEIQFNISGFTGTYSFSITGSTPIGSQSGITTNPLIFNGLSAGTYTITATDDTTNCVTSFPVNVEEPPTPLVIDGFTVTNPSCSSSGDLPGDVVINASGGWGSYSYELFDPNGTLVDTNTFGVFNGISDTSGAYVVTVTDANGCTITDSFSLAPIVPPILSVTPNNFCYNSTLGLTLTAAITSGGEAPFQYTINGGVSYQSSSTFSGLAPGNYTVGVVDSKNCTDTFTITINPTLNATATLVKDLDCSSSPDAEININIISGTSPYSYEVFRNGSTFQTTIAVPSNPFTYTTNTSGTYTFTITDAASCIVTTNQIVVTDNIPPTVAPILTSPLCNGDTNGSVNLNITGGAVPYSIVFNGSAASTQQTYSSLSAGFSYPYTITDNKGCITSGTLTLSEPDPITFDTSISQDYNCITNSATIQVSTLASGGTPPYEYSIDGVNFSGATLFTGFLTGIYTITVRDANSCTATSIETITPLNPPTDLSFTSTAVVCPSITSDITVTVTDGNAPFTYEIIAPLSSAINNGTNASFAGLAPGTYTFNVTDAKGCSLQENYTIDPIPQVSTLRQLVQNVSCTGDSDGEFSFTVRDFVGTFSYTVENSGGTIVQSASGITTITPINVTNLSADTYVVTVIDDTTNCESIVPTTINEPVNALNFTISQTDVTCLSNATITVSAFDGWGSYAYQLESTVGPTIITPYQGINYFTNVPTGNYTIYVRDANGCIVTQPITILPPSIPTLTLDPGSDLCYDSNGITTILTASSGVAPYLYSVNGGVKQSSNVFTGLIPGTYDFIATDAYGCSTAALQVIIPTQLIVATAVLTKDLTCDVPIDATIVVTITGGYTDYDRYEYSTDGGITFNPGAIIAPATNTFTFVSSLPGNYIFRIYDALGCTADSNSITIQAATNPQATHIATNPICNGSSDGVVELIPVAGIGTPAYQYSFNGSAFTTQRVYSGLSSGISYPYTIRDTKGCFTSYSVTLVDPPVFDALVTPTPVACDNVTGFTTLGSIQIDIISGGDPNFTYTLYNQLNNIVPVTGLTPNPYINTPDTNVVFEGLPFGDYYLRVINGKGCEYYQNPVRVIANPFLTLTSNVTPPNCIVGGSVDLTAENGSGNYTFEIYGSGIPEDSTAPGPNPLTDVIATFNNLNPGQTYIFKATDNTNSCESFVEVTIPTVPGSNINIVPTPVITNASCFGSTNGSITFQIQGHDSFVTDVNYSVLEALTNNPASGSGIYTGTASGPGGGPTSPVTITDLSPGDYILLFQESTGPSCSNTFAFRILEPTPVQLELISITNANCLNGSYVTVRATGGTAPYAYAYVPTGDPAPVTFPESSTFEIAAVSYPQDYDIYVQDANGCTATPITITIDRDPEAAITISGTNICSITEGNYSIVVTMDTSGIGPHSMSVDGGAFNPVSLNNASDTVTILNLNSGNHTVRVIDSYGCGEPPESLTIFPPMQSLIQVTAEEFCNPANSGEITITTEGGSGDFNYTPTSPAGPSQANNGVFTGLTSGTYTFDILDNVTGCLHSISTAIAPTVNPNFTLSKTDVDCFGSNNGTITVTLVGGNTDIPYQYSLDSGVTIQPSNIFTGLIAGNYNVTVISAKGCEAIQPINITQPTQLAITAITSDYSCDDIASTITVTINDDGFGNPTGTSPNYLYSFNGGSFQPNNIYQVAFGSPNVLVSVQDTNGCPVSTSVAVPVETKVTATIAVLQTIDCVNGEEIISITPSSGSGNYSYIELPIGTIVPDPTNIILTTPNIYVYEIIDTTTNCSVVVTHSVAPYNLINVTASLITDAICSDSNDGQLAISITGYTGPFDYQVLDNLGNPLAGINGSDNATADPYNFVIPQTVSAGSYTIRVTETAFPECIAVSNTVTVDAPETVMVVEVSNTPATCNSNAIVVVQASGGTPGYTYAVLVDGSPAPTLAGDFTEDETLNLNPAISLVWDVYARDSNGCISQVLDITITLDTTPDISLTLIDPCAAEYNYTISVSIDAVNIGVAPYRLSIDGAGFQSVSTFPYTYTGLSSGSHDVTVRDANGCIALETITISPELGLEVDILTSPSCTNNDGLIEFTITGGSGSNTIDLFESDGITATGLLPTGNQFTGLGFGIYIVKATDATLGSPTNCTKEVTVTLEPPSAVTLQTTQFTNVSCFGASDGSITVLLDNASAGINDNPPYIFTIDNGTGTTFTNTTGSFSSLPSGTYAITVTSSKNCTATDSVTIIENPELTASAAVTQEFTCSTDNNTDSGQITISVLGGTAPFLYRIDGGNFQNSPVFTVVDSGMNTIYNFTIRDANGCLTTTSTSINTIARISLGITNIIPIACDNLGETITVVATGASTPTNLEFQVLGTVLSQTVSAPAIAEATFILPSPGTYTIQVTDVHTGCYQTIEHTISVYDTITVGAIATAPVICYSGTEGTIEINVSNYSGPYAYTVYNSNGTATTITGTNNTTTNPLSITGLISGNYFVRVLQTAYPSCSEDSNTITINSPNMPLTAIVEQIKAVTCTNDKGAILVEPSGGYAPYDIQLTNSTTGVVFNETAVLSTIFTQLSAATYNVLITDSFGCQITDTEILIPPVPISANIIASTTTLACFGDANASVTATAVTGGQNNYQYQLNYYDASGSVIIFTSGAQASPTFNNLGAGIYSITISDTWNCYYETALVTILEPTDVSASLIQVSTPTCLNDALIRLYATGGTPPYQYSTDNINFNPMSGGNTHNFTVSSGSYQYYVIDNYGCKSLISNQISIETIPPLMIIIDRTAAVINCNGESTAIIRSNATGGLGNYQYELLDSPTSTTPLQGPNSSGMFTNLLAGDYYVKVTSNDCEAITDLILITEPQPLIYNDEYSTIVCADEANGYIRVSLTGGSGEYQYAISPNLAQFDTTNEFNNLAAGTYTVIAQDKNGCFFLNDYTITNATEIALVATPTGETCLGNTDGIIDLVITGGIPPYSTRLENTPYVVNLFSYSSLAPGVHTIFVVDDLGCETSTDVLIPEGVNIKAAVTPIYECTDTITNNYIIVTFDDPSAASAALYQLDSQSSTDVRLEPSFTNIPTGDHTLIISLNGCVEIIPFTIQIFEPLELTLENNTINEITAIATGGDGNYTFYFNDFNNGSDNTMFINKSGTYTVKVIDGNGCESLAVIEMEFIDIAFDDFFTPNGDVENDTWKPRNLEGFPDILITIYDRYGRRVYHMRQTDKGWDGRYKNSQMPTGDYWYIVKLQNENDGREFVGHFTLYR